MLNEILSLVFVQVASGEKIAAFALTEPTSGSDAMVSI